MSTPPRIFVSYSRKDQRFADELMMHLSPLQRRFTFDLWTDQKIAPGDSWKSEIEDALRSADIALLLVSADYLASEWISGTELPRLLERAREGQARVIPIILRSSRWTHTPLVYFQALPRDAKPFAELTEAERDRAWVDLVEVLEAELQRLTSSEAVSAQPPATPKETAKGAKREKPATVRRSEKQRPKFFISHAKEDGDFAENLKGRLKEVGLDGWIDIDVLEAGVDWRKEIDEAILASQALILILSPDSKSSEYVTYEWAFALGSGLRIVPLMLRDTGIHPRLEAFQYLDFTNRRARPWSRLVALLEEISGERVALTDTPIGGERSE